MIRMLSLAAALAVLPLSTALAAEPQTPSEAAIETAAKAFEARMEAFGARAERIGADKSLTEAQREARIAAVWEDYAPDVAAFTAEISSQAGQIAQQVLANIDVETLVAEAMNDPEVQSALRAAPIMARGVVQNGAWPAQDPEQMITYGLIAQYALDQASDAVRANEPAAAATSDE